MLLKIYNNKLINMFEVNLFCFTAIQLILVWKIFDILYLVLSQPAYAKTEIEFWFLMYYCYVIITWMNFVHYMRAFFVKLTLNYFDRPLLYIMNGHVCILSILNTAAQHK
jgi:hypothetical protein